MRELNKHNKKKLLKVKPQAEVLAFGAYMFESLQSFNNNSQVEAHSMCSMSNLQPTFVISRTYTLQNQVLQPEVSLSMTFFSYIYPIHAYLYQIRVSNNVFLVYINKWNTLRSSKNKTVILCNSLFYAVFR